jgi:hypothetical protein
VDSFRKQRNKNFGGPFRIHDNTDLLLSSEIWKMDSLIFVMWPHCRSKQELDQIEKRIYVQSNESMTHVQRPLSHKEARVVVDHLSQRPPTPCNCTVSNNESSRNRTILGCGKKRCIYSRGCDRKQVAAADTIKMTGDGSNHDKILYLNLIGT